MDITLTQITELRDHQGAIKEIEVHKDGRLFFARSDDMLILYDLKENRKVTGFYDSAGYDAAIFDPSGNMLVYMSDEKLHYYKMEKSLIRK